MTAFSAGEANWIGQLGNLRNTIRQEMVHRQLADHVTAGMTVLDVGCGQGTQAIRLAQLGCTVTGVEPSDELRALCTAATAATGIQVEILAGSIESLDELLVGRAFDVVCAHGVLMYLPDRTRAVDTLARRLGPSGLLSVTFRNGHALAMRPGLRRDWPAALEAFNSPSYTNELGVSARADLLDDVIEDLAAAGMEVAAWYGVRVFNDAVASDMAVPADEDLVALLDAEDRAGRLDPYRRIASQLHVVARKANLNP